MTRHDMIPATAGAVRRRNAELDDELRGLFARIPADRLHAVPPDGEWSLAESLAHIAEFPHFFAGELRRWFDDRDAEVGRTLEHAERLAAIASADDRRLDELRAACEGAFADMARALESLQDADIEATTRNRRHGPEPLGAFLHRYVIGHKAEHVEQLQRALGQLTDESPPR